LTQCFLNAIWQEELTTRAVGRRRDIAREMAETERTYVSTIGIMCDVYVSPLVHMLKAGEPIISQEEIDAIFSTIVNIRNQNTIFLEMLEQRVARWNITSSIGDAFMQVVRSNCTPMLCSPQRC
jgi:hypothetical protein